MAAPNKRDGLGRIIGYFDARIDDRYSRKYVLLVYGALTLYFLWFLVPVVWLGLSTIKEESIIRANRLIIVPPLDKFSIGNWIEVVNNPIFQTLFINSMIIAVSVTVLTLVLGVLGAYSLSRFTYPGRHTLLVAFLATKMLPPVLILIPFFIMMSALSLIDTYLGIVLAHSVRALPLAMWLLKGFFDNIPEALDEAARIDGCSHLGVLGRVIVPLAKPGIAVAGFYTFVTSWNDFLFVSVISQSGGTRTLPFGLFLFRGANTINWGNTVTAATMTAIPSIVLFILVKQYIIEGLASGGMHGQ